MIPAFAIAIGFLLGVLFAGLLIVVDESRPRPPAREDHSSDSDPENDDVACACARKIE